ncbi:MAG: energy transducer TonB [Lewinella sp.]|nr:energy transducer TonB [Lewinella sp.]
MSWISHPYRRFTLLGPLLYAGMMWLGYQTAAEGGTSTEWNPTTEDCQTTDIRITPTEMTADTVAIIHHFNRTKAVRILPRPIDSVAASDIKAPKVVLRVPPPPPPPGPKNRCGGFGMFERMPIFPGCAKTMPYEERKACGERKLLEFIHTNIRYPATARNWNCAGTAIIEFIVQKDGHIEEAEIIADPGCGLGAIALKAVVEMNEQKVIWTPGRQGGRFVAVKFSLPIRFKLK